MNTNACPDKLANINTAQTMTNMYLMLGIDPGGELPSGKPGPIDLSLFDDPIVRICWEEIVGKNESLRNDYNASVMRWLPWLQQNADDALNNAENEDFRILVRTTLGILGKVREMTEKEVEPVRQDEIKTTHMLRLFIGKLSTEQGFEEKAKTIGASLAARLSQWGGVDILTVNDLASVLDYEKDKDLLACLDQQTCIATIGDMLGARYVISGHVGNLGIPLLNMNLIDLEEAQPVIRFEWKPTHGENEITDQGVAKAADGLLYTFRKKLAYDNDSAYQLEPPAALTPFQNKLSDYLKKLAAFDPLFGSVADIWEKRLEGKTSEETLVLLADSVRQDPYFEFVYAALLLMREIYRIEPRSATAPISHRARLFEPLRPLVQEKINYQGRQIPSEYPLLKDRKLHGVDWADAPVKLQDPAHDTLSLMLDIPFISLPWAVWTSPLPLGGIAQLFSYDPHNGDEANLWLLLGGGISLALEATAISLSVWQATKSREEQFAPDIFIPIALLIGGAYSLATRIATGVGASSSATSYHQYEDPNPLTKEAAEISGFKDRTTSWIQSVTPYVTQNDRDGITAGFAGRF